jgi:Predicted choline kinase involved in LPS biosynthesis
MENIQTTGGVYTEEIRDMVLQTICGVFYCNSSDIENIEPVQEGMTNIVLSFFYNGGKYIYRHPGLGANDLVDRGRESIMQKVVEDAEIDITLVAMSVREGWRISKFIDNQGFDYHDLNHMVRGVMLLKKLHSTPAKVRWDFNVIKKAEKIKAQIAVQDYGHYDDFDILQEKIYRLNTLAQLDGIKGCNVHGDARDVNFLINKDELYLIDWEYAGYSDPGFDLGSYICGGEHTQEEVDKILFIYCGGKPTKLQQRHFYAYIAITGWFYMHWTMFKESRGQIVGIHKQLWYRYAQKYSSIALALYNDEN